MTRTRIYMSFADLAGNLNKLVAFMTNYDAQYNPTNAFITLAAMQAFMIQVNAAIDAVGVKLGLYKMAVDERETAYKGLSKLMTRVIRAFKSSGADENQIADAKTYVRKIQGVRATPIPKDDPNTPEDESAAAHSASQMGYAERQQMFEDFLAFLIAAGFAPNEDELHPEKDLADLAAQLLVLNNAVDTAFAPLSSERGNRNELFLTAKSGIIDRANAVKDYVFSIYGADSTEYKQIKGLRFR